MHTLIQKIILYRKIRKKNYPSLSQHFTLNKNLFNSQIKSESKIKNVLAEYQGILFHCSIIAIVGV